jgi:hypothetical protein
MKFGGMAATGAASGVISTITTSSLFFSELGLDLSSMKNSPSYQLLREYGQIAA